MLNISFSNIVWFLRCDVADNRVSDGVSKNSPIDLTLPDSLIVRQKVIYEDCSEFSKQKYNPRRLLDYKYTQTDVKQIASNKTYTNENKPHKNEQPNPTTNTTDTNLPKTTTTKLKKRIVSIKPQSVRTTADQTLKAPTFQNRKMNRAVHVGSGLFRTF
jgi:hypothetical protein